MEIKNEIDWGVALFPPPSFVMIQPESVSTAPVRLELESLDNFSRIQT
jgi:hypothetical protein